jgi:pimeloyl-ACP methyl ester carboxylesterase
MAETTSRTIRTNGIDMHLDEAGPADGPLVVLCHGFPELAYSWRHQLPALADAGYHVVAPDQRGYGDTSRPEKIEDYDIVHLHDDLLGLLDELGEEQAVFVGHDWGSMVVWQLALRNPQRVRGVVGMSVPFVPRSQMPPIQIWKQVFTDTWFYILYFQEPGVADEDLGRDAHTTMRRFLCGVSTAGEASAMLSSRDGRGMVERMPEPTALPDWLTQEEVDHYGDVFARTGFTGGLNWYRNFDRNWELTPELDGAKVTVPSAFIGGADDPVLVMAPPTGMEEWLTDFRGSTIVPAAGHWVQQEKPAEVNRALLDFLKTIPA